MLVCSLHIDREKEITFLFNMMPRRKRFPELLEKLLFLRYT